MSSLLPTVKNAPPLIITNPTGSQSTARRSQRDRRVPHRFYPLGRTGRTAGNCGGEEPDEQEEGEIRTPPS
jgi:hypothetical protein